MNAQIEKRLWEAADQLRANSSLTAQEYSQPVLGLIFLKFADHRFTVKKAEFDQAKVSDRRTIGMDDYKAASVTYLPESARFSNLLELPESVNVGKALNEAMYTIAFMPKELHLNGGRSSRVVLR